MKMKKNKSLLHLGYKLNQNFKYFKKCALTKYLCFLNSFIMCVYVRPCAYKQALIF